MLLGSIVKFLSNDDGLASVVCLIVFAVLCVNFACKAKDNYTRALGEELWKAHQPAQVEKVAL
jgi:hypothetical protein